MLRRDYDGQNCSIARALAEVGDRWTLLIVRDVSLGRHRYDELLDSLGIASNVLSDRLSRLVDDGILERSQYSDRPARFEYHLTRKGGDLGIPLLALMQWGDRYLSDAPPRVARRRSDGAAVSVRVVAKDGSPVRRGDLEVVPGPGMS